MIEMQHCDERLDKLTIDVSYDGYYRFGFWKAVFHSQVMTAIFKY